MVAGRLARYHGSTLRVLKSWHSGPGSANHVGRYEFVFKRLGSLWARESARSADEIFGNRSSTRLRLGLTGLLSRLPPRCAGTSHTLRSGQRRRAQRHRRALVTGMSSRQCPISGEHRTRNGGRNWKRFNMHAGASRPPQGGHHDRSTAHDRAQSRVGGCPRCRTYNRRHEGGAYKEVASQASYFRNRLRAVHDRGSSAWGRSSAGHSRLNRINY